MQPLCGTVYRALCRPSFSSLYTRRGVVVFLETIQTYFDNKWKYTYNSRHRGDTDTIWERFLLYCAALAPERHGKKGQLKINLSSSDWKVAVCKKKSSWQSTLTSVGVSKYSYIHTYLMKHLFVILQIEVFFAFCFLSLKKMVASLLSCLSINK